MFVALRRCYGFHFYDLAGLLTCSAPVDCRFPSHTCHAGDCPCSGTAADVVKLELTAAPSVQDLHLIPFSPAGIAPADTKSGRKIT